MRLWLQVLFYSIGMAILSIALGITECDKTVVINSLLPISYNQYWFISAYMIMYIISPFLNKFAKRLNKEELKKLLTIFAVIFSIAYSYLYDSRSYSIGGGMLGAVAWFSYLYLLAGYIRMYNINILENKRNLSLLTIVVTMIFSVLLIICNASRNYIVFYYYTKMNSFFVFALSVFIFYIFKNVKIKSSKKLNYIAGLTFAVYLIHENYLFRDYFWKKIQEIIEINSNITTSTILQIICSVIIVFVIAAITEFIRKILEKLILKNKIINNALTKFDGMIN